MPLYYIHNLVSVTAQQGNPWDFKPAEVLSEDVRKNKAARQAWYSNPGTRHSFYSMVEPLNPNARITKDENPPHVRWGFAADYDTLNLSHERIAEAVKQMPLKPSRIEQSLGHNWRLVFTLPRGIHVGNFNFDQFLCKRAVKWLNLDILPCLDQSAFETPTRYLCNGCQWLDTGHGDLPMDAVQAFLVDAARDFDFKPSRVESDVPLDAVEKALREKYPSFAWPSAFELNSQGPTFWIPESTSPMSAIVKPGGMMTFAAHATKPFNTWSDILGTEFAKGWSQGAISKSTENIFFDGHDFFMQGVEGIYQLTNKDALANYLKVNCRISTKGDKQTGISQMDEAMNYIYRNNRIVSAASFAFQRPGIITRDSGRILNTYFRKPITPAAGTQVLGPLGNSPWSSALFRHMLNEEKAYWSFIAWYQYLLISVNDWCPRPGQNIFLAGVHNSGKTLANRHYIGASVGGFMDASEYFLGLSMFNAHLFEVGHWVIDDETVVGSPANMQRTSNMFKKIAANQTMMSHAKFQKQSMVEFSGRLGVTLNLDTNSMRIIGPQDSATLEKTNIYRCNEVPFAFPSRAEVARILSVELPYFIKAVMTVEIPQELVKPYGRYGWEAYHDELLLDRTNQSQSIGPFKELLIESLSDYFRQDLEKPEWRGTVTQLMRLLSSNPLNDHVMRGLKMDQVNRYLEQIQKEGLLHCEADSGKLKTRVWIFKRTAFEDVLGVPVAVAPTIQAGPITPTTKNPFDK
jgi:hypothetical protein